MDDPVRFTTKKTLPAYSRLRAVSWHALELAKKKERGWLHHCMTAMLFSAFCLEAFLNHLGAKQIPVWGPLKRKLSPAEKLEVLSTTLRFSPDFGIRPYQTFRSVFKVRDLLVHAETETLTLEGEISLSPGEMPPEPLSEWEKHISLEGAMRFVDDTKLIVEDLSSRAGMDKAIAFENETLDWWVDHKGGTRNWTAQHQDDDAKPSS